MDYNLTKQVQGISPQSQLPNSSAPSSNPAMDAFSQSLTNSSPMAMQRLRKLLGLDSAPEDSPTPTNMGK